MSKSLRWRVAVVDDHERSRAALRAAVWAAGGDVVGEAMRRRDAVAMVTRSAPDVVVFAVGLADGDGIEAAAEVAAAVDVPAVLCTSRTGDELTRRAIAAGVMAYLLKPVRAAELAPALDIAVARYDECRRLRRALEERKVVERAKGVLMVRLQLSEEAAFQRLRRTAMDSRRPLGDVARAVLQSDAVAQAVAEER